MFDHHIEEKTLPPVFISVLFCVFYYWVIKIKLFIKPA